MKIKKILGLTLCVLLLTGCGTAKLDNGKESVFVMMLKQLMNSLILLEKILT